MSRTRRAIRTPKHPLHTDASCSVLRARSPHPVAAELAHSLVLERAQLLISTPRRLAATVLIFSICRVLSANLVGSHAKFDLRDVTVPRAKRAVEFQRQRVHICGKDDRFGRVEIRADRHLYNFSLSSLTRK